MAYTCKQRKEYVQSLRALYQRGGQYKKAVEKAHHIEKLLLDGFVDPRKLNTTNHGENRIKNCIKYELSGACRLITIHDNGMILFCFAGTHNDSDKWLEKNKGLTLSTDKKKIVTTTLSENASDKDKRITGQSALTSGVLYKKIEEKYIDAIMEGIKPALIAELTKIESINTEEEIFNLVESLEDTNRSNAIYDVFCLLRQDKIREATERVKLFTGENKQLKELSEEEIRSLVNSDDIKDIPANDANYKKLVNYYFQHSDYMDWMLFLHPEQEELVLEDYSGTAKLVGVSGSGKTCVIVKRALRLAQKYPNKKILIITLNLSLARLIKSLVFAASPPEQRKEIEIKAFYEVCQEYLCKLEPHNKKLYDDKTWKSDEHIDEIWSEYYRCALNNFDAEILVPLHDSLVSRGIDAEEYTREEFDWIRSAVTNKNRKDYLSIERTGRSYPIDKQYRSLILKGLSLWENKMRDVGVTDHLGISSALLDHIDTLEPKYRCILVDESQDFGTMELVLIRKLVETNENDLFLSGDAAQKITYKHQSLKKAGIIVHPSRSKSILKNYRNSKEILQFANSVLWKNLTEDIFDSDEFEFLDPEYADISGSAPLILEGTDLADEISSSYCYLQSQLREGKDKKGCIAICGYSLYELEVYAENYDIPVLNGATNIKDSNIFLSDLEQTKGFEFDYVCIANCNNDTIPSPFKPTREQITDLSRLYVTMTRAKHELIISYSSSLSEYITESAQFCLRDKWQDYLDHDFVHKAKDFSAPIQLDCIKNHDYKVKPIHDMTGAEFLYQKEAIGLPASLIEKIRERINGKGEKVKKKPVAWKTLSDAVRDLDKYPAVKLIFGKDGDQLRELISEPPDGSSELVAKTPKKIMASRKSW